PPPSGSAWSGGSYGVSFLFDPDTKQGNNATWLVNNETRWRTTNAGQTWTRVADEGGIHGFTYAYYASSGTLYTGGEFPGRSTDNGATWENASDGLAYGPYQSVIGDGTKLYTCVDGYPPS